MGCNCKSHKLCNKPYCLFYMFDQMFYDYSYKWITSYNFHRLKKSCVLERNIVSYFVPRWITVYSSTLPDSDSPRFYTGVFSSPTWQNQIINLDFPYKTEIPPQEEWEAFCNVWKRLSAVNIR